MMKKKEKQHVCLQKQKLKVDVVEGQEVVLVSLNAGFQVVPARSIGEARVALDRLTPAAIVLDVILEGEATWQDELRRLGNSFLALVAAHPAAPFLLSRPFESPGSRRVSGALLGILDRAGFDPRDAVPLLQALTGMLLGPAVHRATYASAAARKGPGGRAEAPGRGPGRQVRARPRPGDQHGPAVERAEVQLVGGKTFLVGVGATGARVRTPATGRPVWVNLEDASTVIHFDSLDELEKAVADAQPPREH